jgi:hypothetical protein
MGGGRKKSGVRVGFEGLKLFSFLNFLVLFASRQKGLPARCFEQ